jgi:choline kinase
MQGVILAAGLAKRLRPLTDTVPKCLLNIGEKNLLHLTIENLISNDIENFVVVIGYRENMIKDYIRNNFDINKFLFLENTDYANNNNSYSLWMTRDYVKEDMFLLDSDILFDKRIIEKLINSGYDNCLAVDVSKELDEEQIKVKVDGENRILEIGKEVDLKSAIGESIGIEKFSKKFLEEMYGILERKIIKENNVNEFYEVTFQEILDKGARPLASNSGNAIYSVNVSEYKCIEIDTVEDYNKAQKIKI